MNKKYTALCQAKQKKSQIRTKYINNLRIKNKKQESSIDESDSSILTQEIYVIQNSIIYSLDEQNEIAEVIGNKDAYGEIFIPYSISCLKKRFIVTSILQNSFKNSQTIRSLNFPDNSKLKTIEKDSFANSTIESLTLLYLFEHQS